MALSRELRLHQYLDDWLITSQSPGRSPSEHSGSGRPNPVLGVDNKSEKIRTDSYSGVFVCGLRIPSRFSNCKTHSREMAQTSGFDPMTQVKACFDCKMFCVACLNGKDGPGGTPSHEALSVSSQGALEIYSVTGQPPSLDRCHFCTPRLVAEKRDEGRRHHPKDHSIQLFTDASNEGWDSHLDQRSTQGLWSDQERRLHINVLELKVVSLALRNFIDQCQDQTVLVAMDNSTVVAFITKQVGTHSVEMCALLWKVVTWCHHYHMTLKARHILGCLNVMPDLLSRSSQVQSTEWSLHPQVFKQICQKWFTPPVDLFATHLNHKIPLYVSPVPDPKAWDIDALNINSPSQGGPKDQAMPLPDHRNSPRLASDVLVLGPSAALNRDPTITPSINDSTQSGGGADNSKNKASLWKWQRELLPLSGHQQGPPTSQGGPYLKNGTEKIRWISLLHL